MSETNQKTEKQIKNRSRRKSKELSYLLRHDNHIASFYDKDGYVPIDKIIESINITNEEIQYLVDNQEKKKRFETKDNKIRAIQGHSTGKVNISSQGRKIETPLDVCFHDTFDKYINQIKLKGLNKMERDAIHLSNGKYKGRSDSNVRVHIDIEKAMTDGVEFYETENFAILTTGINGTLDPKYFKKIENI